MKRQRSKGNIMSFLLLLLFIFNFKSYQALSIHKRILTKDTFINNETPLSLEQTKESKVIEITFNNEVTLEQINSLSLTSTTITTPVS